MYSGWIGGGESWVWLITCRLMFTGHHSNFRPPLDTCCLVFPLVFPSFFFPSFCLLVTLAAGIGDILCLSDSSDY